MKWLAIFAVCLTTAYCHQAIVLDRCTCFNHGSCAGPSSGNGCRSYFVASSCLSLAEEQHCPDGEVFDVLKCNCTSSAAAVCQSGCLPPDGVRPLMPTTTPALPTRLMTTTTISPNRCPNGWVQSPSDRCYKFVTDKGTTWRNADLRCHAMGGLLATPKTSLEMKWIRDYREDYSYLQDRMWIGGFKRSGTWYWKDANQTRIRVTDWASGEPSGFGESCLQLFEGSAYRSDPSEINRWNDVSCDERMEFICERPPAKGATTRPTTAMPTTTPLPKSVSVIGCPDGWIDSLAGICYKYLNTPQSTWAEANQRCQAMDSFLASPRTLSEIRWIRDYREAHPGEQDRTWIGGIYEFGSWWWEGANVSMIQVTDWAPGEPTSFAGSEKCLQLFEGSRFISSYSTINRWNDANCEWRMSFLCQKNSGAFTETTPATALTSAESSAAVTTTDAFSISDYKDGYYNFTDFPDFPDFPDHEEGYYNFTDFPDWSDIIEPANETSPAISNLVCSFLNSNDTILHQMFNC